MQRNMTTDKRTYVLDTNVLLHDPNAVFAFDARELAGLVVVCPLKAVFISEAAIA